MNMILTMSSFIFPIITFPYVSRVLGPSGTGSVNFATSLITYFNMFAQLGIPTYGIRACAKVRDNKEELTRVTHELLTINLVMSLFAYAGLAAALFFVPSLKEDRTLYILVSALILFNAIGMNWLYQGLEKYTYITLRSIAFKLIALGAMFLLVRSKSDYVRYGFVSIFASSASSVLNFIHARRYISFRPVGGYHYRRHFRAIAVFFAMSCATTVYTNLDTVMLGFMKTKTDVGYYNAAVKIKTILVSIVTSLGSVLLPRASYYVEKKQMEEFRRITVKALTFVLLLAAPMTVYFILFASNGIYFLSGSAYTQSIVPMQIIMPTLLFIGLTNILGIQIMVPLGKEKYVLYSELAGAAVDFALNWLLIPRFSSAGAAIGTLAAELVVLIVQYYVLKDQVASIFRRLPFKGFFTAILLGCASSVWVRYVFRFVTAEETFLNMTVLAISALLFFGVYLTVLTLFRIPLVLEIEKTFLNKLKRK
jgi:O-antigen/teichoic acid export membrane protein